MKKVNRTKAYDAIIDVLDNIYDHDSVRNIKQQLNNLKTGQELNDKQVDEIFMGPSGNWADFYPKSNDPHKAIKVVCAAIKSEMFR
jgi:hypothetical protein